MAPTDRGNNPGPPRSAAPPTAAGVTVDTPASRLLAAWAGMPEWKPGPQPHNQIGTRVEQLVRAGQLMPRPRPEPTVLAVRISTGAGRLRISIGREVLR